MRADANNEFRSLLEDDPPPFLDRVNTPWDQVPDFPQYNQLAYNRIVRALRSLSRSQPGDGESNSQGVLVLGEAGTGKTHLLMRVARNLSESNHILFVRKPNNEEAVAQHVWANVVSSLARSLPTSGTQKSQLDDLLAHVFRTILVPELEEAEYMDIIRDIIQKLYYQERLTFRNLERQIEADERLSTSQRRRAMNRMSFAHRWINDERSYEWADILKEGVLNIFDLRMQAMEASEALKLCLIITDLIRRTKNGVNKLVVFDEAHEYVDCKELVGELENAITQIRHDGLSFVLASQFPDRIPERIFKYLLTRLVFKLPNAKAINYVRKAAPNLDSLMPHRVANLDLEQGVCYVQTDDDCTDPLLRVPQLLEVRPRCTMHSGATIRNAPEGYDGELADEAVEESEAEVCPKCGSPLVLKRGPVGHFIGCSGYPACKYSQSL